MDGISLADSSLQLVADFTVWMLTKYFQLCDWIDDSGNDWLHS